MESKHDEYESPLATRYASKAMRELFSPQRKFATWRRLWLALAEAQKALGLDISDTQIEQMAEHLDDIDFQSVARYEKQFKHDVMAHIHAFGDVAPLAKPIIHLGATSQFVVDNADLILMREALEILIGYLANIIDVMGQLAVKWRNLPCLAYTHFQPAQLTTFGKRITLWCCDFVMDLRELERRLENLEFRSTRGATGTEDSFLALFNGDHDKVRRLREMIAEKMGFKQITPVTGQTYSRKIDAQVLLGVGSIGTSVHKFCNDIRLLAGLKEVAEPFEPRQVGSSAMPYKRNPMRCERATALARFLMDISVSSLHTAAEQWLERTLDDSAHRRLVIPESFLAADGMLRIVLNVIRGLRVNEGIVAKRVEQELPFIATERILMRAVKSGGDRQELHERLRKHALEASEKIITEGSENDLIDRIKADSAFAGIDLDTILEPSRSIGRAPEQVDEFISACVEPVRRKYAHKLGTAVELEV
ncbi:MAG: adenylosuccinate lyase [Candidatus Hydrothermarchaeota archaeon]|nr:MAG: adenylosuccinate lyase [Candidatus Hydrothermarchaeota archaeon]